MRHNPPTAMEMNLSELEAVAIRIGRSKQAASIMGDCHGLNRMLGQMRSLLQIELHSMMCRGELTLCSRAERRGEFPCPVPKHVMVT